jgi:hypothetical protein
VRSGSALSKSCPGKNPGQSGDRSPRKASKSHLRVKSYEQTTFGLIVSSPP